MSAKKPLIFVHPLSESLKKLHEVITEISEDEKIEIYDVDEPGEVAQLIPTVGQSLSIFGNAKKCAMVLQPNRKAINKLNSKVILLSGKSLPRKTLDKFSKIGLTECITEPVAPKTLLYKVKLLLRSIVVSDQDGEEEESKSFASKDEEAINPDEQQRLEKGVMASDDVIDYNLKGKISTEISLDAQEDEENESSYKEAAIEGDWKGKVDNNDLALEGEEEKRKKEEDAENYLDAYLRGKKSNSVEASFEEEEIEKKERHYDEEELDQVAKEGGLNLDLDADEDTHDKEKKDGSETENDDKYYKGKVASQDLELDSEDDSPNQEHHQDDEEDQAHSRADEMLLDLEADEEESNDSESEHEDEDESSKKNNELDMGFDLEAQEDESQEDEDYDEEDEEKRRKAQESLDLEEDDERKKSAISDELLLGEDKKEENEDEENEEIDKYYKGKVAKTLELTEEEEIDARNHGDIGAALEDDEDDQSDDEASFDLDADEEQKDFEGEDHEDEDGRHHGAVETSLNLEEDDEDEQNDKLTNLTLEDDETNKDLDDEDLDEQERERKKKELDLALSSEDDERENNKKDDEEEGDYNQAQSGLDLDLDLDDDGEKKRSAHTEHIDTNYDSRKSTRHDEQDWDIVNKKDKNESYDQDKKKKSDIEISFKEKVDLGEQTIDYRKLKNEFDAITINRVGNKKRKTGPRYQADDEEDIEYLKSVYGEDYQDALDEIAAKAKAKKEKEEETIYEPNPQGLDIAIKVMNLYHQKDIKKEEIFEFIAMELLSRYKGHTFFYSYSNEKKDFINSYAFNGLQEIEGLNYELLEEWNQLKEEHMQEWKEMNLPKWHDERFVNEINHFFYPVYEGANKLGFAVVLFGTPIEKEITKSIEVILETTRGIVLDEFHKSGMQEKYDVNLNTENTEKKEGFVGKVFGRFFKKKAG